MPILRGAVTSDAGVLAWSTNGHSLPLPSSWSSTLGSSEAVLGIRPEHVALLPEPASDTLPAEVYVSEALGNETLVRLTLAGQELVARADASYEPPAGTRVWVRPNLARAHLFDARTQQRLV